MTCAYCKCESMSACVCMCVVVSWRQKVIFQTYASHIQMGIAIGFLIPPILVPNVDDVNELAYHIRIMFYISAGVATLIFILVIIGKSSREDEYSHSKAHKVVKRCQGSLLTHAIIALLASPFQCHITPTVMLGKYRKERVILTVCASQWMGL